MANKHKYDRRSAALLFLNHPCGFYPRSSVPRTRSRTRTRFTLFTMASSFLLRSTLPRSFASATGRNVLRSALQGMHTWELYSNLAYLSFRSENGKLDYATCTRWTYVIRTPSISMELSHTLDSYLPGYSQRPHYIPSSIKDSWLVSLGIRAPSCSFPCTYDRSRLCDIWVILPSPRWTAWYQLGHALSYWGT